MTGVVVKYFKRGRGGNSYGFIEDIAGNTYYFNGVEVSIGEKVEFEGGNNEEGRVAYMVQPLQV